MSVLGGRAQPRGPLWPAKDLEGRDAEHKDIGRAKQDRP